MQDFRKLTVWEKADDLAVALYKLTSSFPSDERFNLISQIRRAAVSIPTNIAEGCGYDSNAQFSRFLSIAYGSTNEVDYLLHLAKRLEIVDAKSISSLHAVISDIRKMLNSLIKKVDSSV